MPTAPRPALALAVSLALAFAGPARTDDAASLPKVLLERDLPELQDRPAPGLHAARWIAGTPPAAEALKSKVVLVAFWEVWGAGSRRLLRELAALHGQYGPKGLVVVAVHPAEQAEAAEQMARARQWSFAVAVDDGRKTATAWGAARAPELHLVAGGKVAYAAIDGRREGNLEAAVKRGLAGKVGPGSFEVPARLEPPKISTVRGAGGGPILEALGGKPAPELEVQRWANRDGGKLADLVGKVVLVDFWGTWCGPCVASLPHVAALYEKYKDKGLAVVGVHTSRDAETLDGFLKTRPLPYPVAVDKEVEKADATASRYKVSAYPTLVFLDRQGRVRYVRLGWAQDAEAIVTALLAEKPAPPPDKAPPDNKK